MLPALLLSCGCDLTAECLPATEDVRVQFPAAAPISIKPRTSLCSRVSKTQLAWGSTRAACQFPFRGRGRQVMHLPCKQAHMGAVPIDSTNFNCGENEIQASLISSASVSATPTPATNLGRCSGCRSVKPVSQTTVGSDDWSI